MTIVALIAAACGSEGGLSANTSSSLPASASGNGVTTTATSETAATFGGSEPGGSTDTTEASNVSVTFAELEAAFFTFLACVEGQGVSIEGQLLPTGDQEVGFSASTEAVLDAAEKIVTSCEEEHFLPTLSIWQATNSPDLQEQTDVVERIRQCLVDLGIGDENSPFGELLGLATTEQVEECDRVAQAAG